MTGDPAMTVPASRDPVAEAVVTEGLAAYNRETFGRVDTQTLDRAARERALVSLLAQISRR